MCQVLPVSSRPSRACFKGASMATQVLVPPLGTTVDTITFVSWYKNEGDPVRKGEPLYVIETDKANLDIEAPASGILRGVLAHEGDEFKALSLIAYIVEEGETLPVAREQQPEPKPVAAPVAQPAQAAVTVHAAGAGRLLISPRARRLAEDNRIPLSELKPSGPEGAIIERDVRMWMNQHAETRTTLKQALVPQPPLPSPAVVTVGERLHLSIELDAGKFVAWHDRLLAGGLQASYTSMVLYIASRQLVVSPLQSTDGQMVTLAFVMPSSAGLQVVPLAGGTEHSLARLNILEREASDVPLNVSAMRTQPNVFLAVLDAGGFGLDTFIPAGGELDCALLCLGKVHNWESRKSVKLSLVAGLGQLSSLQAARFLREVARLIEDPELMLAM